MINQAVLDKIFSQLFLIDKQKYMLKPKFSFINAITSRDTKLDNAHWMHARLKGMSTIARRKYGVYNKAISGNGIFRVFPWLDYYN